MSIANTHRVFARRLIEIGRDYEKNPHLKYLLVKPPEYSGKLEQIFAEKLFKTGNLIVPFEYNQNEKIILSRPISILNTMKEIARSPILVGFYSKDRKISKFLIVLLENSFYT